MARASGTDGCGGGWWTTVNRYRRTRGSGVVPPTNRTGSSMPPGRGTRFKKTDVDMSQSMPGRVGKEAPAERARLRYPSRLWLDGTIHPTVHQIAKRTF